VQLGLDSPTTVDLWIPSTRHFWPQCQHSCHSQTNVEDRTAMATCSEWRGRAKQAV